MPLVKYFRKKKITLQSLTPNDFYFTAVPASDAGVVHTSNTVALTGYTKQLTATCSNCTISVNGGGFVSTAAIPVNASIRLRVTAATWGAQVVGAVTIGTKQSQFVVSTIPSYLNWFNSNGVNNNNAVVTGNTVAGPGLQGANAVLATGLPIPKDGNWWYFEGRTSQTYIVNAFKLGLQTSSNINNGTVTLSAGISIAASGGVIGLAIRWYNNSWVSIPITIQGSALSLTTYGTNYIGECYPGIGGAYGMTTTFLPHVTQHAISAATVQAAIRAKANFEPYKSGTVYPLLS